MTADAARWFRTVLSLGSRARRYGTAFCRSTVAEARDAARRRGHSFVGTEHLFIGLLENPDNGASRVLRRLTVDVDNLRRNLNFWIERADLGAPTVGAVRFSQSARRALENGLREAGQMQQRSVGTGHLLIALVADGKSVAAELLRERGVVSEDLRAEVLREPAETD